MKKMVVIILTTIILIVLISGITLNSNNYTKEDTKEEIEIGTWNYYGNIENMSKRLNNNVWGLTEEEVTSKIVKSYIYYKFNGNFGWEWNRPDPGYGGHTLYPEITIGTAPYTDSSYSTTPYLPIKLRHVNNMTSYVEYRYVKNPVGEYNFAYDIWFIEPPSTKKAEIMIWIQGDLGDSQMIVSDGINEYKYYYRANGSWEFPWDYHAFVLKDQNSKSYQYMVNIDVLFDWLIHKGELNTEWNLPAMSLGNEVGKGSGRIEISKFIVNINGNDI